MLNGSVKNSKVTELSNVRGLNSVGGFVGYSGKSGVVKADKIDVIGDNTGQLLGGALGVMDILVLTLMTVQLQELMMVTLCRVQMEMSRLPEDLSDMQILQECRIVQQVTKRTRKLD